MFLYRALVFLVSFCLLLVSSLPAYAHVAGQAPFFRINGTFSPLYPVPSTSLSDFPLPQDRGPKNYLINQPINFVIDPTQLAVPKDVFDQTKFTWDFGDGTAGFGSQLSHTYKRPGSYVLKIDAQYQDVSGAQLFQSIMLNVLPDANYILPRAVMAIDGKTLTDPLTDVASIPFGQAVQFDASKLSGGSSNIVSYFWDFGDGKSGTGQMISHTYDTKLVQQQVFPVLRVKVADGFIADTFAEIDNKGRAVQRISGVSKVSSAGSMMAGAGILIVVGGGVVILGKKKRGKR